MDTNNKEHLIKEQAQILGLKQGLFSRTGATVQFKGTPQHVIDKDFLVSDGEHDYKTTEAITLDIHGIGMAWCIAIEEGAWPVPAETVTIIKSPITKGIKLTCINFKDGIPSKSEENIDGLQERVNLAFSIPCTGTVAYLKHLLAAIGVRPDCVFVEKSPFKIVVKGLFDDYQVANAIFNSGFHFPALTLHTGRGQDKIVKIRDDTTPTEYLIKFVKATEFPLSVDVTFKRDDTDGLRTIKKQVAKAIYDYLNNLDIDFLNLFYIRQCLVFETIDSLVYSHNVGNIECIFYPLDGNGRRLEPLVFEENVYKFDAESYPVIALNHINVWNTASLADVDEIQKWQQVLEVKTESEGTGNNGKKERDLTKWMRETWIKEGKPEGTAFFDALKKYEMQPNSPIREHYTISSDGAGIRWITGSATNNMTKKRIQTKVSEFKKELQQISVNSKKR